jgi:hypothetical protein
MLFPFRGKGKAEKGVQNKTPGVRWRTVLGFYYADRQSPGMSIHSHFLFQNNYAKVSPIFRQQTLLAV